MDVIRPQSGPQEAFLSTSADIAIYGGAAGGGKTWALLLNPLRHIKTTRGYGAVIFRRTVPEITNEGGLWDEACDLYPILDGVGYSGTHEFRFPPYGNTISMAGLENEDDVLKWHSSQICCLEFDELTTFSAKQFWYLTSRNRSTCGICPTIRAGCNPSPGWLKTSLLAPWVDENFNGPRARGGELRSFVRPSGVIKWVEHGYPDSQTVTFIPAKVTDNKILLRKDPGYLPRLKALDPVERARLLEGDWRVRYEGVVYGEAFDPRFNVIVEHGDPRGGEPECGGMDFGVRNAFVALWGHVDHDDCLWITECYYSRGKTIPQHSPNLPMVDWWADPAGLQEILMLKRAGHSIRSCVHIPMRGASGETKSPKAAGISMVRERMRTGRLKIIRPKCLDLVRELGLYRYDDSKPEVEDPIKADDHSPDALRYLIVGLDRGRSVPPVVPAPTEQETALAEKANAEAHAQEHKSRDEQARERLFDDDYWGN